MTQPIIGIAGNQLPSGSKTFEGNAVSYTPQAFVDAIFKVGGTPLILPVGPAKLAETYVKQIDKLLLAGGHDVTPRLYAEDPDPLLGATNYHRDLFEQALINEALAQNKPILAVCRGLQLLNVTLGGNLYQDLSYYTSGFVKHDQTPTPATFTTHEIILEKDSLISDLVADNPWVNSYHHQGIKRLSSKLKATAWSNDRLVEAVEWHDSSQRVLGVQWHPELSYLNEAKDLRLFDFFINQL